MKVIFILLMILSSLNLFAQNTLKDPFGITYDSDKFSIEDEKILSNILEKFNLNIDGLVKIKYSSKDYFEFIKISTHKIYCYSKEENNISLESFLVKRKNKQLNKYYSIFSDENNSFKKIVVIIF